MSEYGLEMENQRARDTHTGARQTEARRQIIRSNKFGSFVSKFVA